MMTVQFPNDTRTLIDALLEEQRDLTTVERFARWHETNGKIASPAPHRALIPFSAPKPGEQYAFEVNLDRCSGCKSCVAACHSLNGLDEDETWRSTGLLHGGRRNSFQQTITTACHHCVDPGCLTGCPVLAYDKDPLTGIVRHLDDQCIGCQYCIFMCPYEVPKYSETRGIVRKCDMCHQRLEHGEAPACVQACPSEAIRITIVEQDDVRSAFQSFENTNESIQKSKIKNQKSCETAVAVRKNSFLPCSPDPDITLPTTRYLSARPLPDGLIEGDAHETPLQPTHWPLVWMLVLTQLGAGAFALVPFLPRSTQRAAATMALVASLLGLAGSILHLGRPLKAWRAFLGLRRSWLSREIVSFGTFAFLAMATVVSFRANVYSSWLLWITAATGLFGVYCSGMTYHVTQRQCWRGELSIGRFFGTTAVLGLAACWCSAAWSGGGRAWLAVSLAVAVIAKLSRELAFLRGCADDADLGDDLPADFKARSAFLMRFRQGAILRTRLACAWLGGVMLPLLSLIPGSAILALTTTGLLLCLAGEMTERLLFFRAAAVPRMPGSMRHD